MGRLMALDQVPLRHIEEFHLAGGAKFAASPDKTSTSNCSVLRAGSACAAGRLDIDLTFGNPRQPLVGFIFLAKRLLKQRSRLF